MISFHTKYEVYCTEAKIGYFRYPELVGDKEYYFTYETAEFIGNRFDPDCFVYTLPTASNLYANNRELMLFKKRFAPVSDADQKALNFPYGYARDYK